MTPRATQARRAAPSEKLVMRVREIRPHRKGCSALANWPDNPWGYFKDPVYLDAAGRKNGMGERWLHLGCNSLQCTGLILVPERDLSAMVERVIRADAAPRPRATRGQGERR